MQKLIPGPQTSFILPPSTHKTRGRDERLVGGDRVGCGSPHPGRDSLSPGDLFDATHPRRDHARASGLLLHGRPGRKALAGSGGGCSGPKRGDMAVTRKADLSQAQTYPVAGRGKTSFLRCYPLRGKASLLPRVRPLAGERLRWSVSSTSRRPGLPG